MAITQAQISQAAGVASGQAASASAQVAHARHVTDFDGFTVLSALIVASAISLYRHIRGRQNAVRAAFDQAKWFSEVLNVGTLVVLAVMFIDSLPWAPAYMDGWVLNSGFMVPVSYAYCALVIGSVLLKGMKD